MCKTTVSNCFGNLFGFQPSWSFRAPLAKFTSLRPFKNVQKLREQFYLKYSAPQAELDCQNYFEWIEALFREPNQVFCENRQRHETAEQSFVKYNIKEVLWSSGQRPCL